MMKHFPNLVKEIDIHVQKLQRVLNKRKPKRSTPRHVVIKMTKVKDKENLKSSKRKTVIYKGAPTRPLADFSTNRTGKKYSK